MGEPKPASVIEATLSHYGKHYFIDVQPEITFKGRGVEYIKTYVPKDFHPDHQRRVGWHSYKVTTRAFEAIKAAYEVSYEMLLD